MTIMLSAIDNTAATTHAPQLPSADRAAAPGFTESLVGALKRDGDDEAAEQQAREAAEQLVASAFLLPLMSELRKGTFRADFLEPVAGRDAFEQKLHTRLADHMVQRMDLPIVDAVTRYVTQHGRPGAADIGASAGKELDRHG